MLVRRIGCWVCVLMLSLAWGSAAVATSMSENQSNDVMWIEDLLAPAQIIRDVVVTPPGALQFTSVDDDSFSLVGELPGRTTTVVLRPESGRWDISAYSYFRVDLVNNGTGLVWIRGRLDNPGAEDWWNSAPSQAFIMPGERATLGFPFPRANDQNDAPAIFGQQSGKPNGHRAHWKAFDPANVIACRLVIQSTASELKLEDLVISVAYPYGVEANAERMELPFLDRFGQVRQLNWDGKVHSAEELQQRHEDELIALGHDEGPTAFNQFGGWAEGPQLEATGFFRTEKVNDRWWLVDPEGRLFFSHGANSVGFGQRTPIPGRADLFEWLPESGDERMAGVVEEDQAHFMVANLVRTFGAEWQEPARDRLHRRLRQWGMNTLGAWSDNELMSDRRTPYTAILHAGGHWSPLGYGISDPFAPDFKERIMTGLQRTMPNGEDPWCVGVFIDNEIDWTEPFVHNTFARPDWQPARRALLEWLEEKYGDVQRLNVAWETSFESWDAIREIPEHGNAAFESDVSDLKRLIAGTYYRITREAMREVLPNTLYLGSRQHKGDIEAYEESIRYLDVISFNTYQPLAGSQLPRGADIPVLETEFHFAAPDRGVPGVGLMPVGDQLQRSRSYIAYVVSSLQHPNVVGTHWFAFPDQSAAGRPGENYQIGFVDVTDTPYAEITEITRIMSERMYDIAMDPSTPLLEVLESMWSEEPSTTDPTYAYTVAQVHGVDLQAQADGFAARGDGSFRIHLQPADESFWDLSTVQLLGLMLHNRGASDVIFDLKLRNPDATDWSNSALGRTIVKPGESIPLGIALQRLSDYAATHPAFLRMSGRPDRYFRHWHTFDPARVRELVIHGRSSAPVEFDLGAMFPLRKVRPAWADRLPLIDPYGQYMQVTWPGKVFRDDDLTDAIDAEAALVAGLPQAEEFNQFGGWAAGPQLDATGFFRTAQVDGSWWFVDPEGRLFWSFGMNCVGIDYAGQTPTERDHSIFFNLPGEDDLVFGAFHVGLAVEENFVEISDVPHYDYTGANLFRKYGDDWPARQVASDLQRMRYANLNTIGAWSDVALREERAIPYVAMIHYVYDEAATKLPDPFHPNTRTYIRQALEDYPVNFREDPWCLGVFVDNELHWHNDARHLVAAILGHHEPRTPVRRAFQDWLESNYMHLDAFNAAWGLSLMSWDDLQIITDPAVFANADPVDCAALAAYFADRFFGMIRDELDAFSGNHLYLGSRMNAAPPEVLESLARHADVISANIYSYDPSPGRYGSTDKPVLIAEFHFANVAGNNLGGGLRSAQDAEQQARQLRAYMHEAVRHPQIIGVHWFQWRDQSVAGRYDGENFDIGLFDVADRPKPQLIRAFAESGRDLYEQRGAPLRAID